VFYKTAPCGAVLFYLKVCYGSMGKNKEVLMFMIGALSVSGLYNNQRVKGETILFKGRLDSGLFLFRTENAALAGGTPFSSCRFDNTDRDSSLTSIANSMW
jgi:hypothetical protein